MSALGQQLIQNVRNHAAHSPTFVYVPPRDDETGRYGACQYVRNGGPSCLLGRALWDAKVIDADLECVTSNHIPFHALMDELQLEIEPSEANWLRKVQQHQDNFRPWDIAVLWADNGEPKRNWTAA